MTPSILVSDSGGQANSTKVWPPLISHVTALIGSGIITRNARQGPVLLLKFSYVRGRGKIPDLYSYKLYIRSKGAQKAFLSSVSNSLFVARIIVRNV